MLFLHIALVKHLHIFRAVERLNFADDFVLKVGVFPDQRGDFLSKISGFYGRLFKGRTDTAGAFDGDSAVINAGNGAKCLRWSISTRSFLICMR